MCEKCFQNSRRASRSDLTIKPILKICSGTSSWPRKMKSTHSNTWMGPFKKNWVRDPFLGGIKKKFPFHLQMSQKIWLASHNHNYFCLFQFNFLKFWVWIPMKPKLSAFFLTFITSFRSTGSTKSDAELYFAFQI